MEFVHRRRSGRNGRHSITPRIMRVRIFPMRTCAIFVVLLFAVLTPNTPAQTASGTLRGRITDPSGAVIPNATVAATTADGKSATTVTNSQGVYEFKGLRSEERRVGKEGRSRWSPD